MCHRYNVKYDVFYAKVLQCSPLHSVDAGWQNNNTTIIDSFYIAADPSAGDVLHEKSPGTDLIGQGKKLWIICFFSPFFIFLS